MEAMVDVRGSCRGDGDAARRGALVDLFLGGGGQGGESIMRCEGTWSTGGVLRETREEEVRMSSVEFVNDLDLDIDIDKSRSLPTRMTCSFWRRVSVSELAMFCHFTLKLDKVTPSPLTKKGIKCDPPPPQPHPPPYSEKILSFPSLNSDRRRCTLSSNPFRSLSICALSRSRSSEILSRSFRSNSPLSFASSRRQDGIPARASQILRRLLGRPWPRRICVKGGGGLDERRGRGGTLPSTGGSRLFA
jgi:hypothetical protein